MPCHVFGARPPSALCVQIIESGELRRGSHALTKEYLDIIEAEMKRVKGGR